MKVECRECGTIHHVDQNTGFLMCCYNVLFREDAGFDQRYGLVLNDHFFKKSWYP